MSKNYVWKNCDECKRKVKRHRIWGKKLLCYSCYSKKINKITYYPPKDLKEELNKIREVRCHGGIKRKDGKYTNLSGILNLPRILIGRKVKLILIE